MVERKPKVKRNGVRSAFGMPERYRLWLVKAGVEDSRTSGGAGGRLGDGMRCCCDLSRRSRRIHERRNVARRDGEKVEMRRAIDNSK